MKSARDIVAALWWVWHRQREIAENTSRTDREAHLYQRAKEEMAWGCYIHAKRLLYA
jgi:hypothetical protein